MKSQIVLAAFAALILVVLSDGRAPAATVSCSVTGATMAFGNYDVYGAAHAVTGTIRITCAGGGSPTPLVTLSAGNSGVIANRDMPCMSGQCLTSFPSDLLNYNLYTTVAHTTVFGATGQATTPANCTNKTCTRSVFGLVPKAVAGSTNDVAVGGYADSVTITVAY